MHIRLAKQEDLDNIMKIYSHAKTVMRETGNKNQWNGVYPSCEDITEDIEKEQCYLCVEKEEILAVFAFIIGEDETYGYIENGHWSRNDKYGTIHRIASSGLKKGAADFCYDFCKQQISHVRADTHKDNRLMQKSLIKNGFRECGIIYIKDGSPRIAYEYYL